MTRLCLGCQANLLKAVAIRDDASGMGIGRVVGGAVAGLGLVGLGYTGLGGQDETTRDDAGAIVEGGEVGAFRIRTGDCITGMSGTEIESVQGVPCSTPHEFEVYHAFNVSGGGDDYPGENAIFEQADEGCYNAFEPFVGASYQESALDFTYLYPTDGSWSELDDREILCMIGSVDGTELSVSVRGSGL